MGKRWDTCHTTTISGVTDFSIQRAISGLFPLFKCLCLTQVVDITAGIHIQTGELMCELSLKAKRPYSSSWYTVEIEVAITQNWFASLMSGLILRDRFRSLVLQKSGTWNQSRTAGTLHWREARAAWRRHWVWPNKCWMDYIFHLDWKCLWIPLKALKDMAAEKDIWDMSAVRQWKIDRWVEYLIVYFPARGTTLTQSLLETGTCHQFLSEISSSLTSYLFKNKK